MLCLVRFSAMPGHITTAIQSCIGISIWLYGVGASTRWSSAADLSACFLTLPKQFSLVYIGKIFGDITLLPDGSIPSDANRGDMTPAQIAELDAYHVRAQSACLASETAVSPGSADTLQARNKRISLIVFFATIAATVIAGYMVYMRARAIRPQVLAEMEARKLAENGLDATDSTAELGEISRDASKLSEFTLDEAGSARLSMIKRGSSFYLLNTPSLPHIPCAPRSPRTTLTMCRSGRASERNRRRLENERGRVVRLLQLQVQHGPRATQVLARQPVLGAPALPASRSDPAGLADASRAWLEWQVSVQLSSCAVQSSLRLLYCTLLVHAVSESAECDISVDPRHSTRVLLAPSAMGRIVVPPSLASEPCRHAGAVPPTTAASSIAHPTRSILHVDLAARLPADRTPCRDPLSGTTAAWTCPLRPVSRSLRASPALREGASLPGLSRSRGRTLPALPRGLRKHPTRATGGVDR